jgi:deoxyadenosine/deoxycytidine kinase
MTSVDPTYPAPKKMTRIQDPLEELLAFCLALPPRPTSMYRRPYILSVEGNIGAGKTSLLDQLEVRVDPRRIVVVREPVDTWMRLTDPTDGESILQKIYKCPAVYSFTFQTVVFHSIMQSIDEAIATHSECEIIVCERSLAASRHVFCAMLKEANKISAFEMNIYESFFTPSVMERYYPDNVFFLDVDPSVCMERIQKRDRKGEEDIPLDYLIKLDHTYRQWLPEYTREFLEHVPRPPLTPVRI